jgi:beta-glucanase (GH16 family)
MAHQLGQGMSHSHTVKIGTKTYTTSTYTDPAPVPGPYTLDLEFEGSTLDLRLVPLWSSSDPGDRLDTDARAAITMAQVSQANGIMTLACERKATPSGRPFAGATISTYGTFSQRYGTFETRMRYDEAKGTWPSWFFLPVGQKAPYPEIDAMESYGDSACLGPGFTENVVHYAGETTADYAVVPLANSSGWHVHKFVWTPSRVDFYIDGVNTFSVTNPAHVPQVPMYPIYTFGVGANQPSCRADASTPAYLSMQVDYLRVSA